MRKVVCHLLLWVAYCVAPGEKPVGKPASIQYYRTGGELDDPRSVAREGEW